MACPPILREEPNCCVRFWRADGGPFETWRNQGTWSARERDDPVVNCNILIALRLLGAPPTEEERAGVARFVGQKVHGSRYYCSPYTIAHAAFRAGLDRAALPPIAVARPRANDLIGYLQWLCSIPERDETLLAPVLAAQHPEGFWPIAPWVTGEGDPKWYWGSPALTTAIAIEALARHASP
jgi:hypothetical protein